MAIILAEYVQRSTDALKVLVEAGNLFGEAAVLLEQEVNVRFQAGDDAGALEVWERLAARPDAAQSLNAYSYRRAGICAARLGRFGVASEFFLQGAESASSERYPITKFGLRGDAANMLFMTRDYRGAAAVLHRAVSDLPLAASAEGNAQWQAVLSSAAVLGRSIEAGWKKDKSSFKSVAPGHLSTAGLATLQCEPGQNVRSAVLLIETTELAAALGALDDRAKPLESVGLNTIPYLRLLAARARVARQFATNDSGGIPAAIYELDLAHRLLIAVGRDAGMRELKNAPQIDVRP